MKNLNNFFISCKKSQFENTNNLYGCFYIGPFKTGQSLTLANALRRTLLSEISGIAIDSVYIEGVDHEYCSLKGVNESILDILLNLKEIVFKSISLFSKPLIGYLQCSGPGIIRAFHLKLPSNIQCVNPEQYIATLAYDGKLNLKCLISTGFQYSTKTPKQIQQFTNREKKFDSLTSKTPLTLDPVFNPIKRVNYTIESSNFHFFTENKNSLKKDILILEIWTNGSIHPREALLQSISNLNLLFSSLSEMELVQKSNSIRNSNQNIRSLLSKMKLQYKL